MQARPGIAALLRGAKRRSDLTENLVFADQHRVEARRHREEVLCSALLVVHVHVRRQLVESDAGVPGQQVRDSAATPAWNFSTDAYSSTRLQVDSTIASSTAATRPRHRATCSPASADSETRSSNGNGALRCDSPTTSRLTRSTPVQDRACQTVPTPDAVRGTRGSAARWRGRPCAARHPAGTVSTAGAKFSTLRTPAATNRIGHRLRGAGRRRDHADRHTVLVDEAFEVVEMVDRQAADELTHLVLDRHRPGRRYGSRGWQSRRSSPAPDRGCRCR